MRALAPGEVVASMYSVRDEIARTDTGVVYEARDLLLERAVAIKVAWRDPGTPSLVVEARRCALVRDPCAVAVHAMGHHHGLEFAVAERVLGTPLTALAATLSPERYLAILRTLVAAVARAHEAGIAVGELSGQTALALATQRGDGSALEHPRIVLGRLSLSQVPAVGPLGNHFAPEVVRGLVRADDPAAAEAIDLYALGCIAIELARGAPPFVEDAVDVEQVRDAHGHDAPPRLADLRTDVPPELGDLVEWLLAKHPAARPASAADVLAQMDALVERAAAKTRTIRVLVVDDDTARARWLWSLVRRAHSTAVVEIASEGTDAAHKLNRDQPDLVLVDASLRGVMNALELCMYARGLESGQGRRSQIALIGDVPARERGLFADASVPFLPDDDTLATAILERVRRIAAESPRRAKKFTTVSG